MSVSFTFFFFFLGLLVFQAVVWFSLPVFKIGTSVFDVCYSSIRNLELTVVSFVNHRLLISFLLIIFLSSTAAE